MGCMSGYKNFSLRTKNRVYRTVSSGNRCPVAPWYIAPADSSATVGEVLPPLGAGNPGSDHVAVVGALVDSSRQVVLDTTV